MIYFRFRLVTGTLALIHNLAIDFANFFAMVAQDLDDLIERLEQYEI